LQPATTIFLKSLTMSRISASGFDSAITIKVPPLPLIQRKKELPPAPGLFLKLGTGPPRPGGHGWGNSTLPGWTGKIAAESPWEGLYFYSLNLMAK
jgi:hypothetical protein